MYQVELPLTRVEQDWVKEQSPGLTIFGIACTYGYSSFRLEELEAELADGATYGSYLAKAKERWLERYPDPESQAENPFELSYGLRWITFNRLQREWKEWQKDLEVKDVKKVFLLEELKVN